MYEQFWRQIDIELFAIEYDDATSPVVVAVKRPMTTTTMWTTIPTMTALSASYEATNNHNIIISSAATASH
jgi:hypothetical protein